MTRRCQSCLLGAWLLFACGNATKHQDAATGTGGTVATGGSVRSGGGSGSAGRSAYSGQSATGGSSSTESQSALGGSNSATGGRSATGGAIASGGIPGTGGAAGTTKPDAGPAPDAVGPAAPLEDLQRRFVDLRFGMFIHFGILTYTGSWAQSNLDITQFNPTGLAPTQWADAAASAKMKYGVLTTKHHDGFALWPSRASSFNVGNIPWQDGKGDVVRAYVDAFRAKGLLPGLYYSIWDTTQGVSEGSLSAAKLAYIKTQLTELLTDYGPIPILVMDGWSWQMGHKAVPYDEIRSLVKSLQPDCLLTDHTHMAEPWNVDIVNFEEPKGAWAPKGNTYAAQQGTKINASGGNDWFWAPGIGGLMSVEDIATRHLADLESKWTNFLLNCPPNRTGVLDPAIVSLLGQVGTAWSPNDARAPLPAQGAQNERPYTPVTATASSGNGGDVIDGKNDSGFHSIWQPTGTLPQSVTLDLGQVRADVGWVGVVPYASGDISTTQGNITSYAISVSSDGSKFTEISSGTWAADGKMKVATFAPTAARYVKLEARAAANGAAAVTEITVGGRP